MLNRTLRHIARHRRDPIELLLADAVGQEIDQARDVRLRFLDQIGDGLLRRQRLGHGGGERHHLDAEARLDGFDLVREQPGHALSIAERKRCADAHRLRAVVYPMADEVEPAGTEALQFERIAQLDRELGDIARDGFRRADRFSESLADFDQLRGAGGWARSVR
jgi:hypothetical protein